MAQLINVPGMGVVSFPDNMSDNDISAAIQKNLPSNNAAPANSSKNNKPILAPALAGAGQQLANIGQNIADVAAKGLDATGLTTNAKNNVDNYFNQHVNSVYQPIMQENPNAALGGRIGGAIIGSGPLGSASRAVRGGLGAYSGYVNSDPNASLSEKLGNTGKGALFGAFPALGVGYLGGVGASKLINSDPSITGGAAAGLVAAGLLGKKIGVSNIAKTAPLILKSPTDLANQATERTLSQFGGDMSNATPTAFFKNVADLTDQARQQKNALYTARDALAQNENVGVNRDSLAAHIQNLQADVQQGATNETNKALKEANRLYGDGSQITYSKAQSLVSDIGKTINSANSKGNFALGEKLKPIKDALLTDIQNGGGSNTLQELKQNANNFYRDVYAPIRGIDAKRTLAEKYSDSIYMANALKSSLKDPSVLNAFKAANANGLPNNAEQIMQAAHINALKDAATSPDSNLINVNKYSSSLLKTLKDNPTPFANVADKMQTLSKALQVTNQLSNVRESLTQHSIGQKFMLGVLGYGFGGAETAGAALAAGYILPKAKFLFTAGKMLQDPKTSSLLSNAAKINPEKNPNAATAMYSKINQAFNQKASLIPSKLAPVFNNQSNTQQ